MSGKFKISLVVLAGLALSLGACSDIGSRAPSTPNAINNPPLPTPPGSKQTPDSPANRQVSQSVAAADPNGLGQQALRSNYKSIPLDKISSSHSLQGTDPKAIALAAFGNTEPEVGTQAVAVDYPQPDQAVVSITQIGIGDDSVRGVRYRVEFVSTSPSAQTSKQWQMVWAGSQFKCQLGRGHQDWSTENCQ